MLEPWEVFQNCAFEIEERERRGRRKNFGKLKKKKNYCRVKAFWPTIFLSFSLCFTHLIGYEPRHSRGARHSRYATFGLFQQSHDIKGGGDIHVIYKSQEARVKSSKGCSTCSPGGGGGGGGDGGGGGALVLRIGFFGFRLIDVLLPRIAWLRRDLSGNNWNSLFLLFCRVFASRRRDMMR